VSAAADIAPPPLGTLRDRIAIKRRDVADDGEGGTLTTWFPIATVWARVRELSGRSTQLADGRVSALSHTVVLRFRTDISPGDRLVYRGRNLEVISAGDLNGRRAYLSCACSETQVTG